MKVPLISRPERLELHWSTSLTDGEVDLVRASLNRLVGSYERLAATATYWRMEETLKRTAAAAPPRPALLDEAAALAPEPRPAKAPALK